MGNGSRHENNVGFQWIMVRDINRPLLLCMAKLEKMNPPSYKILKKTELSTKIKEGHALNFKITLKNNIADALIQIIYSFQNYA